MFDTPEYIEAKKVFVGMQTSPHTSRAYKYDIEKWELFASHLDEATPESTLAFKKALEENYAPATAQRVWCTVAAFYGWMKGTGRTEAAPFHGIKSPTRPIDESPPVPTDDEIARLLAATQDGTEFGFRATAVVALLLNGLRAQEVCDSRRVGFRFEQDAWLLTFIGKGGKFRTVPINSEAREALLDLHMNVPNDSQWLVPNSKGEQMNSKSVWRLVKHYGKKAGIPDVYPHMLRHHYATRLVRNGVDLYTLQKLMGHTRADTTQRYVSLDNRDMIKALMNDPLHVDTENYAAIEGVYEPVPF